MFGIWSWLRQFTYTKTIIVIDDDIDARNWKDVIWAISTRADPVRDTVLIENTPIDYLDFASPKPGLGGKTRACHPGRACHPLFFKVSDGNSPYTLR